MKNKFICKYFMFAFSIQRNHFRMNIYLLFNFFCARVTTNCSRSSYSYSGHYLHFSSVLVVSNVCSLAWRFDSLPQ